MAVDPGSANLNPFTSTIPLVQVPVQEMSAGTRPSPPLPGQFGQPGTGALAIGDSIIKGMIMGHQMKEQRKAQIAQTTITEADKNTNDAYQQYQDALVRGDDTAAKLARQNYLDAFQKGQEAKKQFIIPEKGTKKPTKDKGVKGAAEKAGGGIKEWFAANPHVIPSLVLALQQPKPEGLSAEGQAKQLELSQAKRTDAEATQKIADTNLMAAYNGLIRSDGTLDPDAVKVLPPEDQAKILDRQNGLLAAKARYDLSRPPTQKTRVIVGPDGQQQVIRDTDQIPEGWRVYEKTPTNESVPNELLDAGAKALGKTGRGQLTFTEMNAILAMQAREKARASGQTTYTYSTVDANGNRSTSQTKNVNAALSPDEQRVTAALGGSIGPQGGIPGMPQAPQATGTTPGASRAAGGPITAPPRQTLTQANRVKDWNTRSNKAEETKATIFRNATATLNTRLKQIDDDEKMDDSAKAQAKKDALQARDDAWKAAQNDYDQESQAIAREQNAFPTRMPSAPGRNGQVSVKLPNPLPNGVARFFFPNQEAADRYKREAGIP